jgi:hypothetical protein
VEEDREDDRVICSDEDRRYCSICFGRLSGEEEQEQEEEETLLLPVNEPTVECDRCLSRSHLTCLAKMTLKEHATSNYQLIPTISCCPMCDVERPWSQIVKERTTTATTPR